MRRAHHQRSAQAADPAFLIRAIGSTEELRAELEADGLVDYLKALGLRIQISGQASQRIEPEKTEV